MKLSAKADYAVRAVLVLASHDDPHPLKGELIAASQDLPLKFVENILGELKHAGLVVPATIAEPPVNAAANPLPEGAKATASACPNGQFAGRCTTDALSCARSRTTTWPFAET